MEDVSAVKGNQGYHDRKCRRDADSCDRWSKCGLYSRLNLLKKKMDITKMELDKIEQGLAKFEEMEKERGVS